MSSRTKIIAAVVALLVVGGAAAYFFTASKGSGPEIDVAKAQKKELAVTVSASGKVAPGTSADVYPASPGTIEEVLVSDGETVTAGQKLATLDTGSLELAVDQARSGLAAAKAQLANAGAQGTSADVAAAKAGVASAKKGVTAASASLAAANVSYDNASAAYDLAKATYGSDSPTTTAAYAAKKSAYAGVKAAESALSSAKTGVKSAQAGYAKARAASPSSSKAAASAAVDAAQSALAEAKAALKDATLRAPIDGVVVFNATSASLTGDGDTVTDGSSVSPASAPFTVVDFGALRFDAEVDEADIDRVEQGMAADVTLDAFAGKTFSTSVARVQKAAKTTSTGGTVFIAELPLSDIDATALLGMKGDATIKVSSTGAALTIPIEALFSEGGSDFVYVVKNNTLAKTEITAGATTDTEVEVVKGIKEGDTVALSGSTQYTDGMSVRVKGK